MRPTVLQDEVPQRNDSLPERLRPLLDAFLLLIRPLRVILEPAVSLHRVSVETTLVVDADAVEHEVAFESDL